MSVEEVKAFGQKVMQDEELKSKAKQVGMDNVDGIIALARENGFDVTKEDFEAAAKEVQSSNQLNEEDLEQVAGGAVTAGAALAGVSAGAAVVGAAAGSVGAGAKVTQTTQAGGW